MFDFFTFYPSRVLRAGGGALGAFALFGGLFMLPVLSQPPFSFPRKTGKIEQPLPLPPLLADQLQPPSFPFDGSLVEERILLALCPRRPDDLQSGCMAHVKIKGSNQLKQIPLPGRIGLAFNERGDLCFRDKEDPFWLELELVEGGVFNAALFLDVEGNLQSVRFRKSALLPLVQKMEELFQEEPFQVLAKARWLGTDLVCKAGLGEIVHKVEIGSHVFELSEEGRLYWNGSCWVKTEEAGSPLAQVRGFAPQQLELDVWDSLGERHIRVGAPLTALPQARAIKVEEWFSSVRIRSDKQISCLLEKQCLILREGDWVLKENGRWRILRKAEDKEQMIRGNRSGELIVLDSIDVKRRSVQGQLIHSSRIQGVPFSLAIPPKPEKKLPDRTPRHRGVS